MSTRSIPACAGEPSPAAGTRHVLAVYPRVCGGTDQVEIYIAAGAGLSPRVRGNRKSSAFTVTLVWSIPACAGEPHVLKRVSTRNGVYPRVCGGTYH